MKEVKISFNKQRNGRDGTYYRGCFTLDKAIYLKFTNGQDGTEVDKLDGKKCHWLNITGTYHLIEFLRKEGIPFNIKRASSAVNYFIDVVG
jgi:hypothetical protein